MIFLVTGPVHAGKTTYVRDCLDWIPGDCRGFLSIRNQGLGYDLFNIAEKSSQPFIRREGETSWQRIGDYYFLPRGLDEAERLILGHRTADLLIVDEVGPLELKNKGLWPALDQVLFSPKTNCLLVVRDSKCEDLQKKLRTENVKRFHIQDPAERLILEITQHMERKQ